MSVASPPPRLIVNESRSRKASIRYLGRDRNPLLVVDNALANPDEVREYALSSSFAAPLVGGGMYYPGYVAPCGLRGMTSLARSVAHEIGSKGFRIRTKAERSLLDEVDVSTTFAAFAPARGRKFLNVHVDGHSWLAVLIYLTPGQEAVSGTAFWRHQPTGIQSLYIGPDPLRRMLTIERLFGTKLIDAVRRPLLNSVLPTYEDWTRDLLGAPVASPGPRGDHGPWQKIGEVAGRFNRMIVYPTWQLHSAFFTPNRPPRSLQTARITLNGFIAHPAVELRQRLPVARLADTSE